MAGARSGGRPSCAIPAWPPSTSFPGVVAVGRVTSSRRPRGQPAGPKAVRHYLLSKYMSAKRLLQIARSHWAIENQLHWVLDVHFNEDRIRARKDHAPENLATLRRLALNILRAHPDPSLHTAQDQARRLGRCLPPGRPRHMR